MRKGEGWEEDKRGEVKELRTGEERKNEERRRKGGWEWNGKELQIRREEYKYEINEKRDMTVK